MASALSSAVEKEIHYHDVPSDVFRSFDFPGANDIGHMFQFKWDFEEVCFLLRQSGCLKGSQLVTSEPSDTRLEPINKDRIPLS